MRKLIRLFALGGLFRGRWRCNLFVTDGDVRTIFAVHRRNDSLSFFF